MRRLLPLAILLAAACAGPPVEAARAVAAAPEEETAPRAKPLHLARTEAAAPSTFPHEPHTGFECRRCHTHVPGHDGHASIACRECHAPPAPPASARPADCTGCHHAPGSAYGCADCHAQQVQGARAANVDVVFRTGAVRVLPFEHARHDALECSRCHGQGGVGTPAQACAGCHERHHRADANCRGCHARVPAAAHPAATVHRGCAGNGCHADATVAALPFSRSLCLVCHAAQAEHEPGGDCAACHGLGKRGAA